MLVAMNNLSDGEMVEQVEEYQASDVVLTPDGKFKSAIVQDVPLIIFKIICSFCGVPLNLLIASAVLRFRRLRSKPRNIFLLGITFSNLFAYVPAFFEIVYYFYPSYLTCQLYVAAFGLPDVYLLLNTFLSLMDRFVAIRHPLWHRKKVTVPRVTIWVVIGFVVATLVNKFLFIVQLAPLNCYIHYTASRIIGFVCVFLFVLCIVARVTVYVQTRKLLSDQQQRWSRDNNKNPSEEEIFEMNDMMTTSAISTDQNPKSQSSHSHRHIDLGARMNLQTLHRMELEATKTLVAGVTSLFILSCPLLAYFTLMTICRFVCRDAYCSSYGWLAPYFKQLGLVHAIYHPIMYIAWNEEFSSVFKRKMRCIRRSSQ